MHSCSNETLVSANVKLWFHLLLVGVIRDEGSVVEYYTNEFGQVVLVLLLKVRVRPWTSSHFMFIVCVRSQSLFSPNLSQVPSTTSLVGYTDADLAAPAHTPCSSAKAEYRGVTNIVAETAWTRNLLHELHSPLSPTTLVYYDNVSAIYLSVNLVQHQRTKHIKIDIHFIYDTVTTSQV
ncbi:ribonuclease H-like domain-containing protein [Tanacetum coccineum]|uniref:Ribonuclease H-like domain-containing protein n=1 Tax=Tanacetum coccineum TaxID=301880 RepID=A0ABQ5BKA9_9ASTR